jgi:putative tryptophan/tyrosine transport system substrate-binding protein
VTAWPLAAGAQQGRTPVVGFVSSASPTVHGPVLLPAFHLGLAQAGFVEGRNVAIEYLWAEGSYERLGALMTEAVSRRVDVTVPVIMLAGDDPVRLGLVASINRPGGNITGVAQLVVASEGKRLEVLRELLPNAKNVALLFNPAKANSNEQLKELQLAAHALGVSLYVVEGRR